MPRPIRLCRRLALARPSAAHATVEALDPLVFLAPTASMDLTDTMANQVIAVHQPPQLQNCWARLKNNARAKLHQEMPALVDPRDPMVLQEMLAPQALMDNQAAPEVPDHPAQLDHPDPQDPLAPLEMLAKSPDHALAQQVQQDQTANQVPQVLQVNQAAQARMAAPAQPDQLATLARLAAQAKLAAPAVQETPAVLVLQEVAITAHQLAWLLVGKYQTFSSVSNRL